MAMVSSRLLSTYIIFSLSIVLLVLRSPALGDVYFEEGIDNDQVIGDVINSNASLFASDILLSSRLIGELDSSESDMEEDGYSAVPAIAYIDDPFVWYRFEEKEYLKEISTAEFDINPEMDAIATISGLPHEVVWYPNDETGNFQTKLILLIDPDNPQNLRAVRLDDDGTLEIGRTDPGSIKQQIEWDKNIADHDERWFEALISSIECFDPPAVETVDLKNNGCQSMAATCEIGDMIVWYPAQKNVKFKSKEIIASNLDKPRLLYVAGLDAVSAFGGDNVWNEYEIESNGQPGSPQFYFDELNTINTFLAADLDIVSAPLNEIKIAWFKNQLIQPFYRDEDRFIDDIDN
jgi:hypothetical protein